MGTQRFSWRTALIVGAVVLASFAVYFTTLTPTFYNLDSAEFAIGAHQLGIVHATGYPLYLLSSKLITTLLPGDDLGYQMNLLSAVYAALTLVNVIWIGGQLDGRQDRYALWGSVIAALMLAFSYYFWASAVVAEVYSLQCWLFSLALGALLMWNRSSNPQWLVLFGLTYGLCFANHMSIVLTIPGMAWYFIVRFRPFIRSRRVWPCLGLALLVGPAFYLYLPLRYQVTAFNLAGSYDAAGQFHPIDLGSWGGVWWMVSGKMFRSLSFAYTWRASLVEWSIFVRKFWGNFIGAGILLGGVGIAVLWRRYRYLVVSWGLMMITHSIFYVNYRAIDKELMFLPVYLIWSCFVSAGCAYIFRGAARVTQTRWLVKGLWILPLIMVVLNYSYADVSWDRRARDDAQSALDGSGPNALIVGWWTDVTPIQYLQYVEDQRPDVEVINRLMISPENLLQMIEQQVDDRPVYVLQDDPMLTDRYDVKIMPHGLLLLTR